MREKEFGGKEMRDKRRHIKKSLVCCQGMVILGILLFTFGQSLAQAPAADDVYVAPQRTYVQKLAEEVKAKHPELVYLNLRAIPPGKTGPYKVGSAPPSRG